MADRFPTDWPAWTETPPGAYILAWEQAQLDRLVGDMFGYHAVQIGLPHLAALRESRMSHRTLLLDAALGEAPRGADGGPRWPSDAQRPPGIDSIVAGEVLDLPFATQSVDLLVLPHVLELSDDPHALLREAERVLVPEGRLVIVGFNSLSLWGVRQSVARMARRSFVPATQNLIAFTRIKDWIKLLGFELSRGRFGCYRPPVASDKWLNRYAFMEKAGDRWWPIFGATFLITAIKRERGMRLIGPAWKKRKAVVPALAPVAPAAAPRRASESGTRASRHEAMKRTDSQTAQQ
ncbi:class I SAM-dependent methyltransferase [Chitinasiproducens palmae]|uniref:Methyltransferase domain-containing protein n=1 Tax=Chitinasiproducens palmae TaxID=1770053 RepID=A0A1H2PVQ5_9BURK|nr:methyltransferase domain-containing protein [Chitinasiproducens palmae]SDV51017.1 Methyltransferase domain-containing protein [Chitinasiproducens palmae]